MSEPLRVVVIHGAHRSRAGLWPAALWLRRRGLDARPFGYRTRAHTLDQHAQRLADFLDTWPKPSGDGASGPATELGFITHSMGALVARRYLAMFGQRHADQHRLVMLGPPNQGATLATAWADRRVFAWAYGRAAAELQPAQTKQLGVLPPHVRGLVIAGGRSGKGYNPQIEGDDDGVVALKDTYLEGTQHEQVGGVHSTLQWRPAVLRRAVEFLREA